MDRSTMVVLIVLIVMIASVMRARITTRHRSDEDDGPVRTPAEVRRMEEEMRALKDRVAVLERIATDPANRTAAEIEKLR